MKRALIGCEESATVREEFRKMGWDAWSCDLLPSRVPGNHYQGDIFDIIGDGWDIGIFFPPCTFLTRAGWHWVNRPDCAVHPLKGQPRREAAIEAAKFFMALLNAPIPKIALENPRPICHVNLPPSTQKIQPWQFGHGEVKETHLWLKNLPPLVPTNIVAGREQRMFRMAPSPTRSRDRSITYSGIAKAMAEQWSK